VLLTAGLGAGVACSGSPASTDGVASVKTAASDKDTTDSSAKAADKGKTSPEDAMLAFARCMREHGVDMPDPDTSGGGGMVTFSAGSKLDPGQSTFEDAQKACQPLMADAGPQNMSPKQQQEAQDQALAFSKCMREHGIDMPDPTFGTGGGVTLSIGKEGDGGPGIDPSDPKFEAAQQACGSAFGPAGAKGGPSVSVSGGKAGGSGAKAGPSGSIFFGGSTSSGGAK
ncbi:MAG TPA: hypothetical protein VGR20_11025, partial [Acidimicrobiia bacterium]|nr:hypothetical protein [Acidimicrobiia bacterium]